MTFFLVIDLVLRIFPFFSHIFRMITVLNVVYDHFLTRKTQFSLCSCFHAHRTTLLLKILGGPMHGRSPTSNFWGDRPPVPLGLRPCKLEGKRIPGEMMLDWMVTDRMNGKLKEEALQRGAIIILRKVD